MYKSSSSTPPANRDELVRFAPPEAKAAIAIAGLPVSAGSTINDALNLPTKHENFADAITPGITECY